MEGSLTFELTDRRRREALAWTVRMHGINQFRPRWPAVAGSSEEGFGHRLAGLQRSLLT